MIKEKLSPNFFTFDNQFLGKMYILFEARKNIFLTIFSTKFVSKIFENRFTNKDFMPKIYFE